MFLIRVHVSDLYYICINRAEDNKRFFILDLPLIFYALLIKKSISMVETKNKKSYIMKPACIAGTNTYVYNFQTYGLHQTINIKIIY